MERIGNHTDETVRRAVAEYKVEQRALVANLAADVDNAFNRLQQRLDSLELRVAHDEAREKERESHWSHALNPPNQWSTARR